MTKHAFFHLKNFINLMYEFTYSVESIAIRLKFGAIFLSPRSLWTGNEIIFGKENPCAFSNSITPNAISEE
jgi:hypothetical protein